MFSYGAGRSKSSPEALPSVDHDATVAFQHQQSQVDVSLSWQFLLQTEPSHPGLAAQFEHNGIHLQVIMIQKISRGDGPHLKENGIKKLN